MSSKPKNAQLPPLEGPARSAVVKKSKSDILGHASEIIRAQSQKLKRELDHEIDRQLSVKIKAQEKAITSLKNGIQTLRSENDQVNKARHETALSTTSTRRNIPQTPVLCRAI